jgi:WD40 repeat protein
VVAVNDEGTTLISGLYNGLIQFWDIKKADMSLEIPSHLAEVTALVFNHEHSILASAGADYLINVWNSKTN